MLPEILDGRGRGSVDQVHLDYIFQEVVDIVLEILKIFHHQDSFLDFPINCSKP
jgi:hypothetical protein